MGIFSKFIHSYKDGNLIIQIIIGMVCGAMLGFIALKSDSQSIKQIVMSISILGDLFVGGLKAVAPILVFVLIVSAISTRNIDSESKGFKSVIFYYVVGTLGAALIAVGASFLFPVSLTLDGVEAVSNSAPKEISDVLKTLLLKIVDNPVNAVATANYIGILAWAIGFGVVLRHSSGETKTMIINVSDAVTKIVRFIIRLAPFGIFGIVAFSVYDSGGNSLLEYAKLLILLVGVMLTVALVVNPLIVFLSLKKNPYPLVFTCLKESGITAFFTRSSAANIPVNLNLCKKLNIKEEIYSVSIPLGASMNMAGAAITISVLALAAVNSVDSISVSFANAFMLSVLSSVAACGASGVPGGSLMLIPLACSLFNIPNDVAMQVVAIGVAIGVIQDSVETALNSSSDVLFTAVASMKDEK
ncbi:serine/threonine transporter SstT [Campylobacter pinnipediorum]|uniref:Serine/threonine transporter SstT n=1 Tax=Campylobacter pinnipediorum subsp. pinnipediorum TaxID=1660067 RepID=A0AAX0LCE0_9BACT|nr:serine/threonine transporter SstT [Campylobacter pinnipediorum]OPA81899.1 serine/threonine transporter SstT [Campylobacter pinnipediorum subsp. pinnipediorum]